MHIHTNRGRLDALVLKVSWTTRPWAGAVAREQNNLGSSSCLTTEEVRLGRNMDSRQRWDCPNRPPCQCCHGYHLPSTISRQHHCFYGYRHRISLLCIAAIRWPSPFPRSLPFAWSLIPSFCSSAGETAASKLVPTSRRAQRNRGDGATNGLYIPQIPEERLGLATVGGSVETILRGHQAGRATIRRQTGTIKPHHLCVLFCVPREAYTLWGAMGREYGEEAACCHTVKDL